MDWCPPARSSTDHPPQPPSPRANPDGGRLAATPDTGLDTQDLVLLFSTLGLSSLKKLIALSGRELILNALVGRDHSFCDPMLPMALGGRDHSICDSSQSDQCRGYNQFFHILRAKTKDLGRANVFIRFVVS